MRSRTFRGRVRRTRDSRYRCGHQRSDRTWPRHPDYGSPMPPASMERTTSTACCGRTRTISRRRRRRRRCIGAGRGASSRWLLALPEYNRRQYEAPVRHARHDPGVPAGALLRRPVEIELRPLAAVARGIRAEIAAVRAPLDRAVAHRARLIDLGAVVVHPVGRIVAVRRRHVPASPSMPPSADAVLGSTCGNAWHSVHCSRIASPFSLTCLPSWQRKQPGESLCPTLFGKFFHVSGLPCARRIERRQHQDLLASRRRIALRRPCLRRQRRPSVRPSAISFVNFAARSSSGPRDSGAPSR